MDTKHYSMIIQWSEEDQAYIVTVPELPGCRTHGETYEEAVKQGLTPGCYRWYYCDWSPH